MALALPEPRGGLERMAFDLIRRFERDVAPAGLDSWKGVWLDRMWLELHWDRTTRATVVVAMASTALYLPVADRVLQWAVLSIMKCTPADLNPDRARHVLASKVPLLVDAYNLAFSAPAPSVPQFEAGFVALLDKYIQPPGSFYRPTEHELAGITSAFHQLRILVGGV